MKRYCVRCGAGMVERQVAGRLRSVCPACGHVDYRQLKVGAAAMVVEERALLLVQRGPGSEAFPGTWNLPAGYCEFGEPPTVAAARETAEETGLEVRVGCLVDAYYFDDDPRGSGLLLAYEAQVVGGDLHCDGRETCAAGFFAPDALPGPLCGGGHDQAIVAWRRRALDRWQPGAPMRFCPHCTRRLHERLAFGRQRSVCPACGFVHFRDPKVGVSLLLEQDGKVLLVQRAIEPGLGQWALPSGFVDWDESPTDAAIRECSEETGLVVEIVDLVDAMHYTDDFRGPGINLIYRARVVSGILRPGDDAQAAQFFAPDELPPPGSIAFKGHLLALARWCSFSTAATV